MASESYIPYAQGGGVRPAQSRRGIAAFACAVISIAGLLVAMALMRVPLGGPVGGIIRGLAPVGGVFVLICWILGVILGVSGIRHPRKVNGFARAALAICVGALLLFGLMILLQY